MSQASSTAWRIRWWSDPFVIITALPAALAGIVWMLFTTGTICRCRR